jgi:hypothetical protein
MRCGRMLKELKNLTQKEIELYRRAGTHIIRYHCTLPHFSQCAIVKTFDDAK